MESGVSLYQLLVTLPPCTMTVPSESSIIVPTVLDAGRLFSAVHVPAGTSRRSNASISRRTPGAGLLTRGLFLRRNRRNNPPKRELAKGRSLPSCRHMRCRSIVGRALAVGQGKSRRSWRVHDGTLASSATRSGTRQSAVMQWHAPAVPNSIQITPPRMSRIAVNQCHRLPTTAPTVVKIADLDQKIDKT